MDNGCKKRRKFNKRRKYCYLLTTSNTWIDNQVLSSESSSLIDTYIEVGRKHGNKQDDSCSSDGGKPPESFHVQNVKEEIKIEDSMSIKYEEDCEVEVKVNPTALENDEKSQKIRKERDDFVGAKLRNKVEETYEKDMNGNLIVSSHQNLDPHSSIFGLIKTFNGTIYYECDFCAKLFDKKSHIVQHRRIHTNERNYKCDKCTKSFTQRCHLLQHIRAVHGAHLLTAKPNYGKFKCDLCTKAYTTLNNLKRHIRKHGRVDIVSGGKKKTVTSRVKGEVMEKGGVVDEGEGEHPHKCERCGKTFVDGGWLLQHEKFECYYTALEALRANKLGVHKVDK